MVLARLKIINLIKLQPSVLMKQMKFLSGLDLFLGHNHWNMLIRVTFPTETHAVCVNCFSCQTLACVSLEWMFQSNSLTPP